MAIKHILSYRLPSAIARENWTVTQEDSLSLGLSLPMPSLTQTLKRHPDDSTPSRQRSRIAKCCQRSPYSRPLHVYNCSRAGVASRQMQVAIGAEAPRHMQDTKKSTCAPRSCLNSICPTSLARMNLWQKEAS